MPIKIEFILHLIAADMEKIIPISGHHFTIGRQSGNDLILDNPEISRRHAAIDCQEMECSITDLGSSNGTRVNGEKLTPHISVSLNPGAEIKIGPFTLILQQKTSEIEKPIPAIELAQVVDLVEEQAQIVTPPPSPPIKPPSSPPIPSSIPFEISPVPDGLSLHSQKLIQYLPDIYHTDFVSRFLGIFEATFLPLEWTIDNFDLFLDPGTAPEGFLPWLANWFQIDFSPAWNESQRRIFLKEASQIYSRRGTRWALSRLLEIFTGKSPIIIDDGNKLDPHTFIVTLSIPENDTNRETIERIIDSNKPAHTTYQLELKPQ